MPVPLKYLNHPARLAALENGRTKFDPETICARGHKAFRYVRSGACCECNALIGAATRSKTRGPRKYVNPAIVRAKHLAEVDARRVAMNNTLPRKVAIGLYSYAHSDVGRARSRYLNSLLLKV
jgi:hypothetical protein